MKYRPLLILGLILVLLFILYTITKIPVNKTVNTDTSNSQNQNSISQGKQPNISLTVQSGFTIRVFAEGLNSPRDLVFSPGGTLLVSDIGSNNVIAFPDLKYQGVAQSQKVVINSGNHIHGLAFYKDKLFVAEMDKVVRYAWDENSLSATFEKMLFTLPQNFNHNNRTIAFDNSGKMFVSVGSTCNICNESTKFSATVIVSDSNGSNPRIFANGLRNAAFIVINPQTQELWGTEMGRDYLGDNLPPDEINIIKEGKNYGWPYCYGNKVHDSNFDPQSNHSCVNTESPIYEIPAHSAPLGLAFVNSSQFPNDWQNDLLVAYHGSWNRSVPTGYKIVHMKVSENTIAQVSDFLTGFLQNGTSLGRPVDLAFDSKGSLFISDDKTGNIYIIQKQQ